MKTSLTLLLFVLGSMAAFGQKQKPNGVALLFRNTASKLSESDKAFIYRKMGFKVAKDGKQFVDASDDTQEAPFDAEVVITDLNKDGIEEVFIAYGNAYTSGNTGSSIVLFIKKAGDIYKENFGFPGLLPEALTTANAGYPDLLIGGPGFTYPVYRWDGNEYQLHRQIKDKDYDKVKKRSVKG